MISLEFFITSIISQAPFVVLVIVVLYYSLGSRIDRIYQGILHLMNLNDSLLLMLQSKGIFSDSEVIALRTYLISILPTVQSKYYTEEVRRRLLELLNKSLDEYSWNDVFELEKIADLIFKEGCKSRREDLISYSGKLRAFIAILKGELLRRGKVLKPKHP